MIALLPPWDTTDDPAWGRRLAREAVRFIRQRKVRVVRKRPRGPRTPALFRSQRGETSLIRWLKACRRDGGLVRRAGVKVSYARFDANGRPAVVNEMAAFNVPLERAHKAGLVTHEPAGRQNGCDLVRFTLTADGERWLDRRS